MRCGDSVAMVADVSGPSALKEAARVSRKGSLGVCVCVCACVGGGQV